MTLKRQIDIQNLIADLDNSRDMLSIKINGFCLWPTVKVALWRFLTNKHIAEGSGTNRTLIDPSRSKRLIKYLSLGIQSLFHILRGGVFLSLHGDKIEKNKPLLIYIDRCVALPDGQNVSSYFGICAKEMTSITDANQFSFKPRIKITSQYFQACTMMRMGIKLLLRRYPNEFYQAVSDIKSWINDYGHCCEELSRSMILLSSAHFYESMHVYQKFFQKHMPSHVVITDFDANFGIIAAAKKCTIPVYDMQHGTFWSGDLDHSWIGQHCAQHIHNLPFPNKLLLFGPFWKGLAKEQGLWSDDDLICVGSPIMDQYLNLQKKPDDFLLSDTVKVLYLSGDIMPDDLAFFLNQFLEKAKHHLPFKIDLSLRLHPRENLSTRWCQSLHGHDFNILDNNQSLMNDVLDHDIVIGGSTTGMIEALMMGAPVISLGAGATPEGIATIHNSEILKTHIPHAQTPDDLCGLLIDMKDNTSTWRSHLQKTIDQTDYFYVRHHEHNLKKHLAS